MIYCDLIKGLSRCVGESTLAPVLRASRLGGGGELESGRTANGNGLW